MSIIDKTAGTIVGKIDIEKIIEEYGKQGAISNFIGRLKWARAAKYGKRMAREKKITEADVDMEILQSRSTPD